MTIQSILEIVVVVELGLGFFIAQLCYRWGHNTGMSIGWDAGIEYAKTTIDKLDKAL